MRAPTTTAQRKGYQDRWNAANPERLAAARTQWNAANPDKRRGYAMKYRYGLGLADYDDAWIEQLGLCAICGQPGELAIDHDHATGRVRGLLHRKCNTAIGMLDDNKALCERAAGYLQSC